MAFLLLYLLIATNKTGLRCLTVSRNPTTTILTASGEVQNQCTTELLEQLRATCQSNRSSGYSFRLAALGWFEAFSFLNSPAFIRTFN